MRISYPSFNRIEPWYLLMGVLGAFNVAFSIMLVPQIVETSFESGLTKVGIIMSAWTAGPLVAPLYSKSIDQSNAPKFLLAGLFLFNGLLVAVVPFTKTFVMLAINLFVQGSIFSICYTILNLLIVRRYDTKEWHGRTSLLLGTFIISESFGFGIAGKLAVPEKGFVWSGIVMILAGLFSLLSVPDFTSCSKQEKACHRDAITRLIFSPFGLMAFGWGLLSFATQLFFLPFPVLMRELFDISPKDSGFIVSVSGLISLCFYPLVGKMTEHFGSEKVLIYSSEVRFFVFAFLSYCAFNYSPNFATLIMLILFINRCTWPFMMVSSQIQAAQLSDGSSKSLALTLFVAIGGLGNFLSGLVNSLIVEQFGMVYVPLLSAGVVSFAILLLMINKAWLTH